MEIEIVTISTKMTGSESVTSSSELVTVLFCFMLTLTSRALLVNTAQDKSRNIRRSGFILLMFLLLVIVMPLLFFTCAYAYTQMKTSLI